MIDKQSTSLNHNFPVLTPHISEVPDSQERFLEPLEVDHINVNLGHLAREGKFPEERLYNTVKEQANKSIELEYQATHDPLTGLWNRRGFEAIYNQKIEDSKNDPEASWVLVYVDLDKFKGVNDTYGHKMGNDLLVKIAKTFRRGDVIARIGGDEFVVLADTKPVGNKQRKSPTQVEAAMGLVKHVQEVALEAGIALGIESQGASAGYAIVEPGKTLDELEAEADQQMYMNKHARKA